MPGARELLLVQHVITSVDRRWQRATERGQGWPGEVRHTRAQPWGSADRMEEALTERSHVGTCRKAVAVAQTDGGGGVAASDSEWPGSHSKRSGTASGSHHGISPPEASSIGAVPWAPGRILPFLSPWGPHVGACAHHHQHPEPQQLVRENALTPHTGASTALPRNQLCPASPLEDCEHFSARERHQPRRPGNDTHMR